MYFRLLRKIRNHKEKSESVHYELERHTHTHTHTNKLFITGILTDLIVISQSKQDSTSSSHE